MNKILTLVTNKAYSHEDIYTGLQGLLTIHNITQVYDREDCVFDVLCEEESQLSPELRSALYEMQCDFALQNQHRPRYRIFISDMDATMVVGETLDEVACTLNVSDKVSAITERAMRGEIPFDDALAERLALMKGIHRSVIDDIVTNVDIATDANVLMQALHSNNVECHLVSGGFSEFASHVSKQLGFHYHHANHFAYDANDTLTGTWQGKLVDAQTKLDVMTAAAHAHHIGLGAAIAIGDGANDALMVGAAGLGIAYYGKPNLRAAANAEIHCGTMRSARFFI